VTLVCPGLLVALSLFNGCASPAAGKKFDVGGHQMRLHTAGEGTPTVVFDAGMGAALETWDWVWPEIAEQTRVALYDRAGLGRSDPGPTPRTSDRIVDELRALLSRAGVEPPYVLVGHSFGGLNMRLFAGRYPDEVVGLVLVDATPEDFPTVEPRLRSTESQRRFETALSMAPEAAKQELSTVEQSADQVRSAPVPDSLRVVVISSSRPEESAEFQQAWKEMQTEMAERLSAEHIVADRSGHFVQFDQPELVIDSINALVSAARNP